MSFTSPLLTEAMKQKVRRTGMILFFLILGLFLLSIVYIIVSN